MAFRYYTRFHFGIAEAGYYNLDSLSGRTILTRASIMRYVEPYVRVCGNYDVHLALELSDQ